MNLLSKIIGIIKNEEIITANAKAPLRYINNSNFFMYIA
jgi:hypothetical protein